MKLIILVIVIFSVFSCVGGGRVNQTDVNQVNTLNNQPNNIMDNITKITGRIEIYGDGRNFFSGIIDENNIQYAIYPPSVEEELSNFQGHLIEFTVRFVNEQSYGSLYLQGGTVTPIEWRILQ